MARPCSQHTVPGEYTCCMEQCSWRDMRRGAEGQRRGYCSAPCKSKVLISISAHRACLLTITNTADILGADTYSEGCSVFSITTLFSVTLLIFRFEFSMFIFTLYFLKSEALSKMEKINVSQL